MSDEKRMIDGYMIIQSVIIDGMEIVVGENPDAKLPYMMWRRSLSESFGAESHLIPVYDTDYLKVLRAFIRCQSVYAENLDLDRIYRRPDGALTSEDCVRGGMDENLTKKVVAIKAETLSPEYRTCSHQLMLVVGGFGCSPNARGRAVLGINIYSGRHERWNRSDILGVIAEKKLPNWAQEKLAALQEPDEKESVIDKIRQSKQTPPQKKSTNKKQTKGGPEH